MDKEKQDCAAIILCGDFNGAPHETFHALLRRLGYVSAHAQRHGREPQASSAVRCLVHSWLGGPWRAACTPAPGTLLSVLLVRRASPAQLSRFKLAAPAPWLAVQGTWPTGIQAPLMDEGDFECLDYVYVWTAPDYTSKSACQHAFFCFCCCRCQKPWPPSSAALLSGRMPHSCTHCPPVLPCLPRRVLSAEVHGLEPAANDKSLFPSDHAAVKATIQLARKLPVELQQEGQQAAAGV